MKKQSLRVSTFVLLAATVAWAQPAPKRIAILPLHGSDVLTDSDLNYLADVVMGECARLPHDQYMTMTRENMLGLLGGKSLEECVGECEVETGHNLSAAYVVSGEVVRFGGELRVTLEIHDTKSGALLGQERVAAAAVEGLEQPVRDGARRLLSRLGTKHEAREGRIGGRVERWNPGALKKYPHGSG